MTKIGAFLKSRGSSQKDAAKKLRISESAFSLKANGWCSFKQNEIATLKDEYEMTDQEVMEVFF